MPQKLAQVPSRDDAVGWRAFLKNSWECRRTRNALQPPRQGCEESHEKALFACSIRMQNYLNVRMPSSNNEQSPYYIVEFKPALGWLFREYLGGYTHWAYGDLDVLFGDMRRGWLEPEELKNFDIITFR